jgi:hypothetical protein
MAKGRQQLAPWEKELNRARLFWSWGGYTKDGESRAVLAEKALAESLRLQGAHAVEVRNGGGRPGYWDSFAEAVFRIAHAINREIAVANKAIYEKAKEDENKDPEYIPLVAPRLFLLVRTRDSGALELPEDCIVRLLEEVRKYDAGLYAKIVYDLHLSFGLISQEGMEACIAQGTEGLRGVFEKERSERLARKEKSEKDDASSGLGEQAPEEGSEE